MFPVLLSFTSFRTNIVSVNRDGLNGVNLRQKHQIVISNVFYHINFFNLFLGFFTDKIITYNK